MRLYLISYRSMTICDNVTGRNGQHIPLNFPNFINLYTSIRGDWGGGGAGVCMRLI